MTITIREIDAARSVEMESKGDVVFMETGGSCFQFDRALFLRAIERELNVVVLDRE
jgi:hypothetical protein